jgi:hypothetical protein
MIMTVDGKLNFELPRERRPRGRSCFLLPSAVGRHHFRPAHPGAAARGRPCAPYDEAGFARQINDPAKAGVTSGRNTAAMVPTTVRGTPRALWPRHDFIQITAHPLDMPHHEIKREFSQHVPHRTSPFKLSRRHCLAGPAVRDARLKTRRFCHHDRWQRSFQRCQKSQPRNRSVSA